MDRIRRLAAVAALILVLAGCGTPRRFGDVDGKPILVQVHLQRAYVRSLSDRNVGIGAGVGVGVGSGGHSHTGVGIGLSFSSTQVYLLGGDATGQGNVFRKQISWGSNSFEVPLTPGRTLAFTVQVQGGYEGWEGIGTVTIPETGAHTIRIDLLGEGTEVRTVAGTAPAGR